MINIKSLELKNFISFAGGPHIIEINNRGILLVLGNVENQRSNGSGKSSLLNAISWCLFGKIPGHDNPADRVINENSEEGCYVKLSIEYDYEIIRRRKSKTQIDLQLLKGDKDLSLMTTSETQDIINDIFGISYESFVASIFLSSREKSFLEMSSKKRFGVICDLLNINRIDKCELYTKKTITQKEKEIQDLNDEIQQYEHTIEAIQLNIENNQEYTQKMIVEWEQEINKAAEKMASFNEIFNRVNVDDIENSLKKHEDYNHYLEEHRLLNEQLKSLNYELKLIEEKINHQAIKEEIDIEEIKKIQILYEENRTQQRNRDKIKSEIQLLKDQKDSIEAEKYEFIALQDKCPICQQKISPNHILEISNRYDSKIENIKSKLIDKIKEFKQIEIENIDYPEISIKKAIEHNNEIKKAKENVKNWKKEKQDIEKNIESFQTKIDQLRPIDVPKISQEKLLNLKSKLEFATVEIKNLEEHKHEYEHKIKKTKKESKLKEESYKERIKENKQRKTEKESESDKLEYETKHYRALYEIYHDKTKLRHFIVYRFLTKFNAKLHAYLSSFGWDIDIQFNEKLELSESRLFSSGEKRRIDLAISFSLLYSKFTLCGPQSNIIVLDEIDNGLDEDGIEKLLIMINDIITEEYISSIFVLTHKSDLKEHISNRIVINNFDGCSSIANID